MFLKEDFLFKERFLKFLKRLGYNLETIFNLKNKERLKLTNLYKFFLKEERKKKKAEYLSIFCIDWICADLESLKDSSLQKQSQNFINSLNPSQKLYLLDNVSSILRVSCSPQNFNFFKDFIKDFEFLKEERNIKNFQSYKKLSEERNLPYTENEYKDLLKNIFKLKSNKKSALFCGVMLTTGLRPIDILKSNFYLKDGIIYCSEIIKTGLKDMPIYTNFNIYSILIGIRILQDLNKKYKKIKISNDTKEIMQKLQIERLYDLRSLYANTMYYFFKDYIAKKYFFKAEELTKPAFLNKILHHIEGSSAFLNYCNYKKS